MFQNQDLYRVRKIEIHVNMETALTISTTPTAPVQAYIQAPFVKVGKYCCYLDVCYDLRGIFLFSWNSYLNRFDAFCLQMQVLSNARDCRCMSF